MFGIDFSALLERGDQLALDFVRFLGAKGGCGTRVPVRNPAGPSFGERDDAKIETAGTVNQMVFAQRKAGQRNQRLTEIIA